MEKEYEEGRMSRWSRKEGGRKGGLRKKDEEEGNKEEQKVEKKI